MAAHCRSETKRRPLPARAYSTRERAGKYRRAPAWAHARAPQRAPGGRALSKSRLRDAAKSRRTGERSESRNCRGRKAKLANDRLALIRATVIPSEVEGPRVVRQHVSPRGPSTFARDDCAVLATSLRFFSFCVPALLRCRLLASRLCASCLFP